MGSRNTLILAETPGIKKAESRLVELREALPN